MESVLIIEKKDTMLRTGTQTQKKNSRIKKLLRKRNRPAEKEIKEQKKLPLPDPPTKMMILTLSHTLPAKHSWRGYSVNK